MFRGACINAPLLKPDDLNALNVIHIAGTKGKGSTSAFCSSLLCAIAPSAKIGLYTSPHLVAVRERIRINGVPISEEQFARYFFELWKRFERNPDVRIFSIPSIALCTLTRVIASTARDTAHAGLLSLPHDNGFPCFPLRKSGCNSAGGWNRGDVRLDKSGAKTQNDSNHCLGLGSSSDSRKNVARNRSAKGWHLQGAILCH